MSIKIKVLINKIKSKIKKLGNQDNQEVLSNCNKYNQLGTSKKIKKQKFIKNKYLYQVIVT